jgi:hypothetical protein
VRRSVHWRLRAGSRVATRGGERPWADRRRPLLQPRGRRLLLMARLRLGMVSAVLLPTALLHLALAAWCIACTARRRQNDERGPAVKPSPLPFDRLRVATASASCSRCSSRSRSGSAT